MISDFSALYCYFFSLFSLSNEISQDYEVPLNIDFLPRALKVILNPYPNPLHSEESIEIMNQGDEICLTLLDYLF